MIDAGRPPEIEKPDHTAVRAALWRALHVELDAAPHILDDRVGLQLIAPQDDWRSRSDMHPQGTRGYRAAIVARGRLIEDRLAEEAARGVDQYVILGAGLDTFAQRRPETLAQLRIFEVDRPAAQQWKRRQLLGLGFGVPPGLELVGVDFEARADTWRALAAAGFDASRPAVVAAAGLSMYLTQQAIACLLRDIARLARGSTLLMSFLLPLELLEPEERPRHEAVYASARAAGTPFISFFRPEQLLALAAQAGLQQLRHVSGADLTQRYFRGRADGLRPAIGEDLLVAVV
ncbi:MAG TPA: class I SAM-dependent methyltransferase [Steroidobacteraceae bacterium]|nr:class I SAM-dependent methyltransferase [Steroidobacteraceae bacterium]